MGMRSLTVFKAFVAAGSLPLLASLAVAQTAPAPAAGLARDELDACDLLVSIPMTGPAESLNVASAAAICLFASQTARRSAELRH